jgi:hypothetical protein
MVWMLSRRSRLLSLLVAAVAIAVIGLGAEVRSSYNDHGDVRARVLADLERSSSARSIRAGSGAPSDASPSGSVDLPLGKVTTSFPGSALAGGVELPAGSSPPAVPGSTPPTSGSDPVPPSRVSVAILSPLLETSKFGASVGFLLVCNTGAGALSAAASQVPGLSTVIGPAIAQISPLCGQMSVAAVDGLTELNDQLRVLNGLTPGTAPFFAAADQVFAVLDRLAPELEPLSATLTSIGPLVDFFQGQAS